MAETDDAFSHDQGRVSHDASGVGQTGPSESAASSAFWAQGAMNDPWRKPETQPVWRLPNPGSQVPPEPAAGVSAAAPGAQNRLVLVLALVASLCAGLVGGVAGYAIASHGGRHYSLGPSDGSIPEAAKRPAQSVAGVVARVEKSVVTVEVSADSVAGNGSGFIISRDGYILTNNHVAEPAANGGQLSVVFSDGSRADAKIVGRDPTSDLAVLKVNRDNVDVCQFGNSDAVRVGDPTIAIGAPLGLNETVTSGIVSALDRPVVTGGETSGSKDETSFMAAIQTDAAINPGNSGGPLVDGDGKVVGVNSAIATVPGSATSSESGNIGIGFAIPINQAKRIAEQLISTGKATTTVFGATLDVDSTSTGGAELKNVEKNGPADKAGLRNGDVVTKFGGQPVDDAVALIALTRKDATGTKVTVEYKRDGHTSSANVTLQERDAN